MAKTILIIEDDKFLRELIVKKLKEEGYQAVEAVDGEEALVKVKESLPDLILLDLILPGVDGFEVLKELRKDVKKYLPVIMLTNLDTSHFVQNAQFDDIDEYLIKSHHSPSEVVDRTIAVLKINKLLPEDIEF